MGVGPAIVSDPALKNFPYLKDAAPRTLCSGGWLHESFGGGLLLLQIATASIIAAMSVNIYDDLQKVE